MGRALGGPQAASTGSPAVGRRGFAPAPATAAATAAAASVAASVAPRKASAIIALQGALFISPVSREPNIRIPSATLEGGHLVYPVRPREVQRASDGTLLHPRKDRRAFDAALLTRMLTHGQVMPIEATGTDGRRDWVSSLWRDGIGTGALGDKQNRPIDEARLRDEWHGAADAYEMPVGYLASTDEQDRGMGLLRTREQVRAYAAQVRGRNTKQRASLAAMVKHADRWWALTSAQRAAWLARQSPQRQAILAALDGGATRKNRELAEAVWGAELRDRAAGDEREYQRLLASKASSVRAEVSSLRSNGVPVEGNSASGYRLMSNRTELDAYITRETGRMSSTEAHAEAAERAGALWYPETPDEEAQARAWRSQLHKATPSAHMVERTNKRRQAQEKPSHLDPAVAGAKRAEEIAAMPLWASVLSKQMSGAALSGNERGLKDEMKEARKSRKTGRWPVRRGGRQYAWDPRPAASSKSPRPAPVAATASAVTPAPWL